MDTIPRSDHFQIASAPSQSGFGFKHMSPIKPDRVPRMSGWRCRRWTFSARSLYGCWPRNRALRAGQAGFLVFGIDARRRHPLRHDRHRQYHAAPTGARRTPARPGRRRLVPIVQGTTVEGLVIEEHHRRARRKIRRPVQPVRRLRPVQPDFFRPERAQIVNRVDTSVPVPILHRDHLSIKSRTTPLSSTAGDSLDGCCFEYCSTPPGFRRRTCRSRGVRSVFVRLVPEHHGGSSARSVGLVLHSSARLSTVPVQEEIDGRSWSRPSPCRSRSALR